MEPPEQRAREMLEEMGVDPDAADLTELADLISSCQKLTEKVGYGTNWEGERWCSVDGRLFNNDELANLLADIEKTAYGLHDKT